MKDLNNKPPDPDPANGNSTPEVAQTENSQEDIKNENHSSDASISAEGGKKSYDIGSLLKIKEDPLSKTKPNVPLLESCNLLRSTPLHESPIFLPISRPNETSFYPFAKPAIGKGSTGHIARKDGRLTPSGKGHSKSVTSISPSGGSSNKPVIHVSLSSREEIKLNEVDSAWKPTRFRKEDIPEEEYKTQEVYKKFRGILNKLTPEKFDTLLDKVKTLEINNQKRLEGVIDLVFEKAIEEPNFSVAYAAMCNRLSMLKVPADNPSTPQQCVNFRALIINRCQKQFETNKVDEQILKLEKELEECTDPTKKKELQMMLEEENRRVRMRSVGNVRFIGELYKLKMLTSKIMDYCMKYLIDKAEEEKLECLCKLLTTIGGQMENEKNNQLDTIFKKMQQIADNRSNNISSRVRFMMQDVIELRQRKWVRKSVVDSQPKTMNQIQREAEQQQRHIEIMNASPMGGNYRRDDGGRNKRGDNKRQQPMSPRINYSVDTSKLKAATPKNLKTIKLAPTISAWNYGSGTKNQAQATTSMISISKNMFCVLEDVQADPTSIKARDDAPVYHSKGASIERSTFYSKTDYDGNDKRSGSMGLALPESASTPAAKPVSPSEPAPAEPVSKQPISKLIKDYLFTHEEEETVSRMKQQITKNEQAGVVSEIFNIVLEKSVKDIILIGKLLMRLVSVGVITPDNFIAGMKDTFEFAPDLYIDIPRLYEFLGKLVAPHIEKKHVTFTQIHKICDTIISSNHGHLLLKGIINEMVDSMGPTFVKNKWSESGMQLKDWMNEDQVSDWLQSNNFVFLEGNVIINEETNSHLGPDEIKAKLLQLMNSDENCECIKGWIKDKLGKASNEDWFIRLLIQIICEYALFEPNAKDGARFNQDRMNKYIGLINEFGENKEEREASCLFGIQELIYNLEHPQGITLEIFEYLHEQYIISLEGFTAWEVTDKEPKGKGVMLKALTSFFTYIKEVEQSQET